MTVKILWAAEIGETVCSEYEFKCGSGACIDLRLRCDRRFDCDDGSDELSCGALV